MAIHASKSDVRRAATATLGIAAGLLMSLVWRESAPAPDAAAAVTSAQAASARLRARRASPPPARTLPAADAAAGVGAPTASWQAEVSRRIAASEYAFHLDADASTATAFNRAQSFRAEVTARGLELTSVDGDEAPLHLGASAIGRASAARDSLRAGRLALGACRADQAVDERGECLRRLEVDRGAVTELWENRSDGLEHSITVPSRPNGDGPLIAQVAVEGAHVTVSPDGQSARLARDGGPLRYHGLVVTDASGRHLPAHLRATAGGLAIHVDDSDARYPVLIDPVLSSVFDVRFAEGNYDAALGAAVAAAGDVNGDGYGDVIVGAHQYTNGESREGRAYLYTGSATGPSTTASWAFESDNLNANLGTSVAGAGDVDGDGFEDVVVGAQWYANGQSTEGAAFVFRGSATGLSPSPSTQMEPNVVDAWFGRSVSGAGDVNGDGFSDVLVGAPYFSNGQSVEGAAFVYLGSSTGVSTTAAWRTESNLASTAYAAEVSRAGDVNADGYGDVVIGAAGYSGGQVGEGRAWLYLGSASGLATTAIWTVESNVAGTLFGSSVSAAGDVNGDGFADVVVAAAGADGAFTNEGRAYVYHGTASGLVTTAAWTVAGGQTEAQFGGSVAGAGDVNGDGFGDVVVGAPRYDNGRTNNGRVYLYLGSASGVVTTPEWQVEGTQADDVYGTAVASAGDVDGDGYADVIIGTPRVTLTQLAEGIADVYFGSRSGLALTAGAFTDLNRATGFSGYSVAYAGDVNGDGFGDVLMGTIGYSNGQSSEGRASLYYGSAAGLNTVPAWGFECDQAVALCGSTVAGAGDVNGDGFADVVVGAPSFDTAVANSGRVFVFHGSATGPAATPAFTYDGTKTFDAVGSSIASAGDVNGDGYVDVIVGVPTDSGAAAGQGSAHLFAGSASGLVATPLWSVALGPNTYNFGSAVAGADVNGDGYADILVGASRYENGDLAEGGVFAYHGSATGVSTQPSWSVESNWAGGLMGAAVAPAGDVDGDGFADVVIGAPVFSDNTAAEGSAFVFHGSASGLEPTARFRAKGATTGERCGYAVSSAGDVDGDGYGDVAVGSPIYANGQFEEGRTEVYLGSATGLSSASAWRVETNQVNGRFGASLGGGDVNGDGVGDLIVGAPYYTGSQTSSGRMFLYFGGGRSNAATTLARKPRITRPTSATPVAPWTRTPNVSWDVAVAGHTPFGRVGFRVEAEAELRGTAFDGLGTVRSGWMTGLSTSDAVASLVGVPGADYHVRWRLHFHPSAGVPHRTSPWRAFGGPGDALGVHLRTRLSASAESCAGGTGCSGGLCADGVCCDTACGGGSPDDCIACSVAAGAAVDGTCGTVGAAAAHACRPAAGTCDVAEVCDGAAPTCPTDAFLPSNTRCRAASDLCDAPETCTGTDAACPPPGAPLPNGAVCRPADPTRACDASETCNGVTTNCPPDAFAPLSARVVCRPATGPCDVDELCQGDSMDCTAPDAVKPSLTLCALKSGACDDDDYCDGTAKACPDRFQPDGWPCDDLRACSVMSACLTGVCSATLVLDCSDSDPCTTDSCSEPTGCTHVGVPACMPDVGVADAGSDGGSDAGGTPTPTAPGGCGCRAAGGSHRTPVLTLVLAFGLLTSWRKRRGTPRPRT